MKIWIIYDSKFGNNKRIAEALAEYFKAEHEVNVFYAKKISPKKVIEAGVDFLLCGGPLRAGMVAFTIKSWITKFTKIAQKQGINLEKAAVWGSHAKNDASTPPQFAWDASKAKWKMLLDNIPAKKHVEEVIGFDINPKTLEGPLEPGWEEIVKDLAERVKKL